MLMNPGYDIDVYLAIKESIMLNEKMFKKFIKELNKKVEFKITNNKDYKIFLDKHTKPDNSKFNNFELSKEKLIKTIENTIEEIKLK